jgi:uncharacterized protein YkwD
MKKSMLLVLLLSPILLFSLNSFDFTNRDQNIYNRLNKLYKSDQEKCLKISNKMIEKNSKNYIAYIFSLKCELDSNNFSKINKSIAIFKYSYNLSNKKEARALVKKVRRLVRYAKIIEKNLDDEIKCRSGYFVDAKYLLTLIRNTGSVVVRWFPDSKDSYIKHCRPICDFSYLSESGSSYTVKKIYGSTRYTVDTTFYLNGLPTGSENIESSSLNEEISFLKILNIARKEKGLDPLKICQDLSRAARYHSYDMGTQNYFQHSSFDRQGKCGNLEKVGSFADRCKKFLKVWGLAENIAAGNYDAQSTYDQWYNSEGHYKNMFSEKYTHIGIGFIKIPNSSYTYYWTTDFR